MHAHCRTLVLFGLIGLIGACETAQTEAPKPEAPEPEAPEPEAPEPEAQPDEQPKPPGDPNTCMPGGLETASKVETIALPRGCQITAAGVLLAPTIVRSESELAEAVSCESGGSLPTIDFSKHQLQVANFMLSPAYAGGELFDDGTRVTYVQRDRSPCPDDPRPMPIGSSLAYLLPQGAARSYTQLACTLPPKCD